MAENEKYVDGLTEAESEDMAIIVSKTINEICLFSDKHNFDRDNMLKYYAELIGTFAEISTIQDFEVEKPQTNADRIRNMSDEELTEFIQKMEYTCFVDIIGYANKDCGQGKISCRDCRAKAPTILDWLQSEAE